MSDAIATRLRTVQADLSQGEILHVVPLRGTSQDQPPYAMLDETTLRSVQITEVSQSGSVPELKVINRLDRRLFIMDGQELIGAKQNRILNTDVLVPAGQSLIIPVSCVEQGRWQQISPSFTSGKSASYRVRAAKMQRVHDSLRQSNYHDAGQDEVWEGVSASLLASASFSPTMALSDGYAQRKRELEAERANLQLPADAVGVAVFHNGQFQGADLFDRHDTLRHVWDSLIDSYTIDFLAADRPPSATPTPSQSNDVDAILARAAIGTWEVFDSPGEGKDCRLTDAGLAGSALVWEDQTVIHLQLFPRQPSRPPRSPRIHRRRQSP